LQNKLKTKTISTLILALLLMSSMLILLPLSNANITPMAAPALGLSATSGNVADYITVNGTGFPSAETGLSFSWIRVSDDSVVAGAATTRYPSLISGGANTFDTDANGYFKVQVQLPTTAAGALILRTNYAIATVATTLNATVTLTAKLSLGAGVTSAFPGDAITWTVSGFGGAETVTVSGGTPAIFAGITGVTNANGGLAVVTTVSDVAGGAKTITATGQSSGFTATASLTVKNDTTLQVTSIRRTAGATFNAILRGFTLGTVVPANSIMVGVATTAHSAVTITNTGTATVPVSLTSDLITQGLVNLTIAGTTFSYQAGNIKFDAVALAPLVAETGFLIASNPNIGATNTAILILDKSSYSITASPTTGSVKVFGSGFTATDTGSVTSPDGAGAIAAQALTVGSASADGNGAFYAKFTLKAVAMSDTNAHRTIGYTQVGAAADTPAGVIISIAPRITIAPTSGTFATAGGAATTAVVTGTGFMTGEDIVITIGGQTFLTQALGGISAVGGFTTAATAIPNLGSGSQTVSAAGATSGNSATTTFTVNILVDATALNSATGVPLTGPAGTSVTVTTNTANPWGIHGLKASTLYSIKFGGEAGITVGSFRSTATGTIPANTRFPVPSGVLGTNIVDIVDASTGVSVIWSKAQTAGTQQYNNLLFNLLASVITTPSAGFVNDTITVTATSLTPNTLYQVDFGAIASITTFNSTATGTVPTGTNFTVPSYSNVPGSERAGTPIPLAVIDVAAVTQVGAGTFTLIASLQATPVRGPQGTTVTLTGAGWTAGATYQVIFGGDLLATPNPVAGRAVTAFTADGVGDVPPVTYFTVPADLPNGNYWIDIQDPWAFPTLQSALLMRIQFTIAQVVPPVGTGTFTPAGPGLINSAGTAVTSIAHGAQFYTGMNITSNTATALSVTVIAQIKDSSGRVVALGLAAVDVAAGATKAVQVPFLGITTAGTYTVTMFVWDNIATATPLAPTTTLSITVS